MIHWGSDVPSANLKPQTPSSCSSDDDLSTIKPKSKHHQRVFAENRRVLSQYDLSRVTVTPPSEIDAKHYRSQTSLDASCERLAVPLPLLADKGFNNIKAFNEKLFIERMRSRSFDDVLKRAKVPEAELVIDIDAPQNIQPGQNLVVYMPVINRCDETIVVSASLRVDVGMKKLKTTTKQLKLEPGKTLQLKLMIPNSDLWQDVKRDDKHFTILATAHNHNTGCVFSKIDHVKINSGRKISLANPMHLFT